MDIGPTKTYRAEFLEAALECGARLTGKPDGSEAIEIVFTIEAWRKFDDQQKDKDLTIVRTMLSVKESIQLL